MRPTLLSVALLPVLAFALVSCGGDRDSNVSASGSTASQAEHENTDVPAGVLTDARQVREEIEHEGGQTVVGDWRIGYIIEEAEPWHEPTGQGFTFRTPAAGETHHIEIIPFEEKTGRVVPDVKVQLQVLDSSGKQVETKPLNFYYAEFFHYANNFAIPATGKYTLKATIEPPAFFRHGDEGETPALSKGATATFDNVEITVDAK
jgi:hypothetical protein